MSFSIVRTVAKQLVMVISIMLILFAAYLSIGRQFMPAISRYKATIEQQITEAVGVPVTIDSVTGYFEGFNPVIGIQGLRIQVLEADGSPQGQDRALEFDSATIVLNMARSIWQRQIVLEDFVVEGLDISAQQTEDGSWQLSGVNLDTPGAIDLDTAYEAIQRISHLQLTDLNIELHSLVGNVTRLVNSTAVIQNSSGNHFIHINTSLNDSDDQILLSVELSGNSLDQISGLVHAYLPQGDYSAMLHNEVIGAVTLGRIVGGGHAWIAINQGQVESVSLQAEIVSVSIAINGNSMLDFEDISGTATLQRHINEAGWEFAADNLGFSFNGSQWRESDSHVYFNDNGLVRAKAESVDLGILREIITASGLGGAGLIDRLEDFRPRGSLRNLSLVYPLETDSGIALEFAANLDNMAVDDARGSPAMSGVNGYVEISHDFDQRLTDGFIDVESENFTIRIPGYFLDTWNYDYVNGRIYIQLDNLDKSAIKLFSTIVVAESQTVDGLAQFSSNIVSYDGEKVVQDFSIVAGIMRADGSKKTKYLPTGPSIKSGLKGTMEWLDGALDDAAVYSSGVIFQGSLLPGSQPEEKNFQAFFEFSQGQMTYVEEWPELTDVAGTVVIDNADIDIFVESARSANMDIVDFTGQVRREENGDQWLTIIGNVSGTTQSGLDFLTVAPIDNNLSKTIEDWQPQGNVNVELELKVPLNVPSAAVEVDVAATLQDNSLFIPEYQLQFDEVVGVINFDSIKGLHDSELRSRFFENTASISISSQPDESQNLKTDIQVNGIVEGRVLAEWTGQSDFVRELLMRTEGELEYSAQLIVQQSQSGTSTTQLTIKSDLEGLSLLLPQPFQKPQNQSLPLSLILDFDENGLRIQGALGSGLTMRIALEDNTIAHGIVYVGTVPGVADPWLPKTTRPGLEVRGNLDILNASEWLDTLASTQASTTSSRDLNNSISMVTLDIGMLDVFGQQLGSINVDVQNTENTDYWTIGLISEAVTGSVLVPFDSEEYIEAYLAFLHLPGNDTDEAESLDEDQIEVIEEERDAEEEERIDILAQVDPRNLPKFKFFTGNFSIGERDFGLGQFTLDPSADGAEFSDLIVNFRGLRAGTTDTENDPHFSWHYDGSDHRSYLSGLILADDLGEILEANGYAASLVSDEARFDAELNWPGSPAFFSVDKLSGELLFRIDDGRFLQGSESSGALKLISIINLSAIMRRARFSDDLLRSGLAFEQISGDLTLDNGIVSINDRLIITGPSSVYQFSGAVDLANKTIDAKMFVTLPISDNIPWIGLLTANLPIAIGAYLFDRIFGDQVDSLTSAQYSLNGPWEGLEPEFEQAFSTAGSEPSADEQPQ